MHNIWTIFKNDLRSLGKCFFACVVAVAIALLPSLYAWLNIYSNWDPYGNTGGISIAVASLDEGYTDENGCYENKGDAVVEDLRNATSINWVIVDTEQEAKQGVEAGDYYAAVVIDRQFTRNMYRMLTDWTGKPAITYYENAKKNAVATKITDTAMPCGNVSAGCTAAITGSRWDFCCCLRRRLWSSGCWCAVPLWGWGILWKKSWKKPNCCKEGG